MISITCPKGYLLAKTPKTFKIKKYLSKERRNEEEGEIKERGKLFSKHSFPGRIEKSENAVK